MTIHLFPIEPIELRYSADWYRWWPKALSKSYQVTVYDGERFDEVEDGEEIEHGQFLDALETHFYKATQLANFTKAIKKGRVRDGDIVLLLDGWNPSVTSLGYIRSIVGINFKIVLVLHAGTWDEWDHLSLKGMGKWVGDIERGWFSVADSILVSTYFHKTLLEKHARRSLSNVKVTGFPLELRELDKFKKPWNERENIILFPHRLAPEKQPEEFKKLEIIFKDKYPKMKTKWIRTLDDYRNKSELYKLLGRSKVAFSCALQETWGIVQLESWYLGAAPVVPPRLSYNELYPFKWKYADLGEAADMIFDVLTKQKEVPKFEPGRHPEDSWESILTEIKRIQCLTI